MAIDITHDLLLEILLRLPVKSLIRFQSVSRSWRSLISSPQFISSHVTRVAAHIPKVLVRRCLNHQQEGRVVSFKLCLDNAALDKIAVIDFPFTSQNDFFTMIGCVDGLVCLSDDLRTQTGTLFLWNPVLRRSLPVPPPSISSAATVVLGFGAAFGDYKLVRVAYDIINLHRSPSSLRSAEIFRLKTGEWSKIEVPQSLPPIRGRQANLNGALHWLAQGFHGNAIVRFHLGREEFDTQLSLPSVLQSEHLMSLTIAVWRGSLAVFRVEFMGSFSMWTTDDGISWVQRFAVESSGLRCIRSLRRSGKVVFEASGNKLVSFDPDSRQISECEFEVEGSLSAFHMRSYSESLLLLDHKDAVCCSLF